MRCRVMTWNVHSWVGSDRRHDIDRIAGVIRRLNPDIVGLQEVDWRGAVEGEDPFFYLAHELEMRHVEGPNLEDHRGHYGNGLLTTLNVESHRNHSLAMMNREPRGALDAILERDGFRVRVFVTHLGLRYGERRLQTRMLHAAALTEPYADACLLLGDLNEWISTRLLKRVFMPHPFTELVTGRTFPSHRPLFPLDCIFAGPEPTRIEGQIVRSEDAVIASDHLPVIADLEW